MKKIIALFAAAAILCACGCGKQTVQPETTVPDPAATVAPMLDDDLALPAVNDSGSTTAAVVVTEQTTLPTTTLPTTQAETTTTEPAPTEPAATEAAVPTETAAPTTEKPTETTTEPTTQGPKTAQLLPKAVLAPINSGTYTITVSAFLKDSSKEDRLKKISRGSDKAYRLSIPSTNLDIRIFSDGGKYYLVAQSKYCELTKEQFDEMSNSLNNYFPDFSQMKYLKTETSGKLLNKTTTEYFDYNGKTVALQYDKNGALTQIEFDGTTLPFSVTSGADSAVFSIPSDLEKAEYKDMEFVAGLFQMI